MEATMQANNMATKQVYRMMLGTSGKQWEELTIKEDGTMTMTFHGTDREISHEVTENEDGWLCYPGAMYPGLASGKWQAVDEQAAVVTPAVQCAERFCREDISQPSPNPKRQRKPHKPQAAVEPVCQNEETAEPNNNHGLLRSAGYLAAASVALAILWQTGLIIPLGLIGLATSGFLK